MFHAKDELCLRVEYRPASHIAPRFGILWNFEFFSNVHCSSNFRKIRAIVLKLHTNIIY